MSNAVKRKILQLIWGVIFFDKGELFPSALFLWTVLNKMKFSSFFSLFFLISFIDPHFLGALKCLGWNEKYCILVEF